MTTASRQLTRQDGQRRCWHLQRCSGCRHHLHRISEGTTHAFPWSHPCMKALYLSTAFTYPALVQRLRSRSLHCRLLRQLQWWRLQHRLRLHGCLLLCHCGGQWCGCVCRCRRCCVQPWHCSDEQRRHRGNQCPLCYQGIVWRLISGLIPCMRARRCNCVPIDLVLINT